MCGFLKSPLITFQDLLTLVTLCRIIENIILLACKQLR